MKINDILEALSRISYCVPDYGSFRKQGLDEDEAEETVNLAIEQAFDLLERMRWIPVSERLPEAYKKVLVCFISKNYRQDENPVLSTGSWCERAHAGSSWYSDIYGIKANVTHWMPLPEPPEQGVV